VLTRYVSDVSLAFTEEYSVVLMVLVTLVGSAYAAAAGRHIRIDFLVERLPAQTRRRAELGALAATVLCFTLVAGYGIQLAFDDYRFEVLSPGLGHPQWLYTAMLPVFSAVIVARTVGRFVRVARGQS
jgi:TRAP-type transport system small permease protein